MFISSDEADELREAGDMIGMAGEAVTVMVDQYVGRRDDAIAEERRIAEELSRAIGCTPEALLVRIIQPDS